MEYVTSQKNKLTKTMTKKIQKFIQENKNALIIYTLVIFYSTAICYQTPIFIVNHLGFTRHNIYLNIIDGIIPYIDFFIIFYVYYYLHIILAGIVIVGVNKEIFSKYITSMLLCCTTGFIIFIIFPTSFTYQHEDSKFNLFMKLGKILDIEYNAIPSFHVIKTYLILKYFVKLNTPLVSKFILFIITFLITLSTVFIKVHSFIDIISSILLVEFYTYIVNKYHLDIFLRKFLIKIKLEF